MADISIVKERTEPFKMSKEHKEMFIEALRSEDYEQAEGVYIEHIQGPNGKPCLWRFL